MKLYSSFTKRIILIRIQYDLNVRGCKKISELRIIRALNFQKKKNLRLITITVKRNVRFSRLITINATTNASN